MFISAWLIENPEMTSRLGLFTLLSAGVLLFIGVRLLVRQTISVTAPPHPRRRIYRPSAPRLPETTFPTRLQDADISAGALAVLAGVILVEIGPAEGNPTDKPAKIGYPCG